MRILHRPMFKYGGPIKEGVMHGMKNGGRAALVGNPVYPKTDGREHHAVVSGTIAAGLGLNALRHAAMRYGARLLPKIKNIFGSTTPTTQKVMSANPMSATTGGKSIYKEIAGTPKFNPNWLGRDPLVQSLGWAGKTLTSPTAQGIGAKALRFAASPSTLIGGLWFANGRWFNKKGEELDPNAAEVRKAAAAAGKKPGHGDEGMYYEKPPVTKSAEELAAEAKAARTKKLNKYLDTMGYDKAKKTAMGDALIDASAIVQDATTEAGSLKKADWGKMINKAIQTTSKRLDKPEQIREAVGLMMTKADIEKDMTADQNQLNNDYKRMQIALGEKSLSGTSFEDIISDRMIKGDMLKGNDLASLLRIKKGIDAKVISTSGMKADQDALTYVTKLIKEKEGTPYPPGHYIISDRIIAIDEQGNMTKVL